MSSILEINPFLHSETRTKVPVSVKDSDCVIVGRFERKRSLPWPSFLIPPKYSLRTRVHFKNEGNIPDGLKSMASRVESDLQTETSGLTKEARKGSSSLSTKQHLFQGTVLSSKSIVKEQGGFSATILMLADETTYSKGASSDNFNPSGIESFPWPCDDTKSHWKAFYGVRRATQIERREEGDNQEAEGEQPGSVDSGHPENEDPVATGPETDLLERSSGGGAPTLPVVRTGDSFSVSDLSNALKHISSANTGLQSTLIGQSLEATVPV